jgi:hypothetical protein
MIVNPERQGQRLVPFLQGTPIAIVDLADANLLAMKNRRLLDVATRYYKRELPVNTVLAGMVTGRQVMNVRHVYQQDTFMRSLGKLRPLSLGLRDEAIELLQRIGAQEKEYDVFFAGTTYGLDSLRAPRYLDQLRALKAEGYRVVIAEGHLPLKDFLTAFARSWLVWSPEGNGWDCLRHYEVAAAGSIPVINYPSIRRYAPMLHQVHAFFYDPEGEGLRTTIVDALRDKDTLVRMSRDARDLVFSHHTHRKQLEYIVHDCLGMHGEQPAPGNLA